MSNVKKSLLEYRQGIPPLGGPHGRTGADAQDLGDVGRDYWRRRRVGVISIFYESEDAFLMCAYSIYTAYCIVLKKHNYDKFFL